MSSSIITGIDIGTYHIKVVISNSKEKNEKGFPKIIGVGSAESRGLRHGYIVNIQDAVESIKRAVGEAEKRANIKVKKAFISIGGIGLSSITSTSSVIITRADSEITALDIKKVQEQCEKDIPPAASLNKKIIHSIPLHFKIDGKIALGKPEGMKGNKLEVKTLYITSLEHHLNDIIQAVEEAGISVQDVMASPIAASLVTLTKAQKIAGCVLANIGAETVSIAVFENNIPVSLEIFPIGSTDITNDIALGLKVPLEEAEQIKVGAITGSSYPRKKLEEIVTARLSDIFELIEAHLKKIGRNGLLPAGIILTGGGASLPIVEEVSKAQLRLPSKIGTGEMVTIAKGKIRDSSWFVSYGLATLGGEHTGFLEFGSFSQIIKKIKDGLKAFGRQFMP
jgi:cell division protein FtsA